MATIPAPAASSRGTLSVWILGWASARWPRVFTGSPSRRVTTASADWSFLLRGRRFCHRERVAVALAGFLGRSRASRAWRDRRRHAAGAVCRPVPADAQGCRGRPRAQQRRRARLVRRQPRQAAGADADHAACTGRQRAPQLELRREGEAIHVTNRSNESLRVNLMFVLPHGRQWERCWAGVSDEGCTPGAGGCAYQLAKDGTQGRGEGHRRHRQPAGARGRPGCCLHACMRAPIPRCSDGVPPVQPAGRDGALPVRLRLRAGSPRLQ